jgi:hypothetical protein
MTAPLRLALRFPWRRLLTMRRSVEVTDLAQALAPNSVGGTRTRAPVPFQVLDCFEPRSLRPAKP